MNNFIYCYYDRDEGDESDDDVFLISEDDDSKCSGIFLIKDEKKRYK